MAEEASRSTNSVTTIRSRSLARRNSLPLFRSDLGKDVPGYLRASTGSCHDHCKYGRKEMCEVTQKRPAIKRPEAARELKASDKSKLGQNDGSKIRKPQTLPSNKIPETSFKKIAPRDKDIVTKSSESFFKSAKSRLLKGESMTRKSASTLGNEKLPGEKECVPWSGDLRDAKSFSWSEDGNVTKLANGLSTNCTMKLDAKAKASLSPAPTKIVARAKPPSSSSPPRVRPAMKARPQSSPKKSKPVNLRMKSSSSPTKSRPVRLRLNASSSPTKSRPVRLRVNSSSSPIRLKPASLKVNSLSSHGSFKAKKSPPSISPRSVSSKKSIVKSTESKATRRGSISSDFKDVANYEKEELQQENLVDAQIDDKNGLQQENLVEAQMDEKNELQEESQVEEQIDEMKEVFEKNEEDLSYETELQNQEEVSESYDNEASEKTLYVIETDAGNDTQPAQNAEDEIPDMQSLASMSPPQSPSSPTSITESNMTTEPEANLMELTNTDTIVPFPDQETLDIEPLPSLSAESLPESQSSIVASKESSLYEVSMDNSIYTDTTVPCADQETLDIEPLPSLSPEILPDSQSSIKASNEVSMDGSVYTDSEEGYSSYEDEHLAESENLAEEVDNINLNKKSKIVTSQENSNDAVKLRFKKGRVIDITHENKGPRRLKFRRARVLDEKTVNDLIRKRSFKITEPTQVDNTTENNSSSVVLRHQDTQDKKDAQVLFNNVIEETASKLVEKRKSMVKALVGAFETVISLQDGKPATVQQDQ